MNLVYILVLVFLTLSSCLNSIRWGRVAQREHYIPGYVTKFYFRWVRLVPYNNLYFFLAIILALLSLWSPYPALLLSVLTLVTPIGLDFKHRTSKVNITERLKRLNIIYCIFVVLISIVSLSMDLGYFLALVVNLFSFYIYDQALRFTKNYEKNTSEKFIVDAEQKIKNFEGPIIAITGSYSKTTTKNILAQILSQKNKTFATPESFNNRLGIAKAINENLKNNDEISIIEMGYIWFWRN